MPSYTATVPDFKLTSTWVVSDNPIPPPSYVQSNRTTPETSVYFDLSSIPTGAEITAVNISCDLGSTSTGVAARDIGMAGDPEWWPFNGATTYLEATKALFNAGTKSIRTYFRFRAVGSANAPTGNRSDSLTFSNVKMVVEYNSPVSACTAPTSISLPTSVSEGNVNISFSGALGGTNNAITGYVVEYAESSDASTWGAWGGRVTISSTSGSGSFAVSPSGTRGRYRKFRVYTLGTAGSDYGSPWKEVPGTLRRNSAPAAPTITAPVASATTYNANPRILATIGSDTDAHAQAIAASGYTPSSTGNQAVGRKIVLRRTSALSAGSQSISVATTDALAVASAAVARSFAYTVPSWTDATLTAGTTLIKAAHINEIRNAINAVRAYYGMAAYSWPQTITAGSTSLAGWTSHINEMRTAINQIVTLVNGWDTASTTHNIVLPTWITINENKPTAAVIAQLRSVIPLL